MTDVSEELVEIAGQALFDGGLLDEIAIAGDTGCLTDRDAHRDAVDAARAVLSAVAGAGWVRADELVLASARTQELRKTAWATGDASDRLRTERDEARAQAEALAEALEEAREQLNDFRVPIPSTMRATLRAYRSSQEPRA